MLVKNCSWKPREMILYASLLCTEYFFNVLFVVKMSKKLSKIKMYCQRLLGTLYFVKFGVFMKKMCMMCSDIQINIRFSIFSLMQLQRDFKILSVFLPQLKIKMTVIYV